MQEFMAALRRQPLHDLPGMTVKEHHLLCIGVLAHCFQYVPPELQCAIAESLQSARAMGVNIKPELIIHQTHLSA